MDGRDDAGEPRFVPVPVQRGYGFCGDEKNDAGEISGGFLQGNGKFTVDNMNSLGGVADFGGTGCPALLSALGNIPRASLECATCCTSSAAGGQHRITWDGRDDAGEPRFVPVPVQRGYGFCGDEKNDAGEISGGFLQGNGKFTVDNMNSLGGVADFGGTGCPALLSALGNIPMASLD